MENIDNLIIEHLKALRSDLAAMRSEMQSDFQDVKGRLNHLESSNASVKRDQALSEDEAARQQLSIDRLVQRIQRIEKRLELAN